jgi:opacity protein-like surface antigen
MIRYVRVAAVLIMIAPGAAISEAQTPNPPRQTTANEPKMFADFNIAATLGHKSDAAVGGEWGIEVIRNIDVFAEFGHMGNVATSDFDARAHLIADNIGATAGSTAQKVNFFDAGVRYRFSPYGMWRPYALFGIGVAHVSNEASFSQNGTDITGSLPDFGVELGADLSGSLNKAIIIVGGGVNYVFRGRYFADLSYRYGGILPKTGTIENDVAIHTQRVQVGIGLRF